MTTQKCLDFATAILRCMEDDNKTDACLAAAELIRTKYTWEQYAETVKQVYQELLDVK